VRASVHLGKALGSALGQVLVWWAGAPLRHLFLLSWAFSTAGLAASCLLPPPRNDGGGGAVVGAPDRSRGGASAASSAGPGPRDDSGGALVVEATGANLPLVRGGCMAGSVVVFQEVATLYRSAPIAPLASFSLSSLSSSSLLASPPPAPPSERPGSGRAWLGSPLAMWSAWMVLGTACYQLFINYYQTLLFAASPSAPFGLVEVTMEAAAAAAAALPLLFDRSGSLAAQQSPEPAQERGDGLGDGLGGGLRGLDWLERRHVALCVGTSAAWAASAVWAALGAGWPPPLTLSCSASVGLASLLSFQMAVAAILVAAGAGAAAATVDINNAGRGRGDGGAGVLPLAPPPEPLPLLRVPLLLPCPSPSPGLAPDAPGAPGGSSSPQYALVFTLASLAGLAVATAVQGAGAFLGLGTAGYIASAGALQAAAVPIAALLLAQSTL